MCLLLSGAVKCVRVCLCECVVVARPVNTICWRDLISLFRLIRVVIRRFDSERSHFSDYILSKSVVTVSFSLSCRHSTQCACVRVCVVCARKRECVRECFVYGICHEICSIRPVRQDQLIKFQTTVISGSGYTKIKEAIYTIYNTIQTPARWLLRSVHTFDIYILESNCLYY